jgi:hypothetical protein
MVAQNLHGIEFVLGAIDRTKSIHDRDSGELKLLEESRLELNMLEDGHPRNENIEVRKPLSLVENGRAAAVKNKLAIRSAENPHGCSQNLPLLLETRLLKAYPPTHMVIR